jgi:hypothetical protein
LIPEDLFDTFIAHPTEVHHSFHGHIKKFDLSQNMMVFLTDEGKVYYSGLWKYFVPTELALPKTVSPKNVAASWDGFAIIDSTTL